MPTVRVSVQPPTAAMFTTATTAAAGRPPPSASTSPAINWTAPMITKMRTSDGFSACMPAAARWHAPAPTDARPANWARSTHFGTRSVRPTVSAVLIVIAFLVSTRLLAVSLGLDRMSVEVVRSSLSTRSALYS